MTLTVGILAGGSNSHSTTSEEANALRTDSMSPGVIGVISNTAGVAPATGAFAVNAQGSPNMTVAVSTGVALTTATPAAGNSQLVRTSNSASANVTIAANATGSTRYDWVYINIDSTKAANPASDASDVATLVTSRSTSNTTDNGTPPTYGTLLAVVTVANGASSITNGNIADKRVRAAPMGGVNDTNGNEEIKIVATSSAVNEITVTNAATGNAPKIAASGDDTNIPLNLQPKGASKVTIGAAAIQIYPYDYIASGCVWTADAAGSTRNGSMTSGTVVINGNPLTVASISAHTFTASKDTYVDFSDNGDGTALVTYTEATNNAASAALAANSVRCAIVVTGASSIAAASSINQGQEDRILPIASSVAYAVTDSLGNLICPRDPNRKVLGYRQITSNATNSGAMAQITGLSVPVIVPTARKVRITVYSTSVFNSTAVTNCDVGLYDGTPTTTQLAIQRSTSDIANGQHVVCVTAVTTPASASKTYNAGLANVGGGTANLSATSTSPAYIMVELV